ncbi:hypothetical protein B9Z55_021073 [Caenorhabditis nigoni]|uniref:Lin-15A/B-like domain-containing protein n=1 Tax=Caenorhabditis nigoni TaxID=1611254 RepID=A0A2G5TQK7_9PELO|nr:hypothetical protein B9Z55_021073 [Caenorhabditis nigoni]
MNVGVIKEEVIEETHNFTFKNGEYVEVKQEEIEQKSEYLLEKEIKKESNDDYCENNNSDGFFEDGELKPKEIDSKLTEITELKCEICQKRMPRSLLKLITSEDDKTALSQFFKFERALEAKTPYVCVSHIQMIIRDNDVKVKITKKPLEHLMRSFIRRNRYLMKDKESRRRICKVCHMARRHFEVCETFSYRIRMVVMIGCILRGTHSVEQAKSFSTNNRIFICYSHFKESIDEIFKYLGVEKIEEFWNCPACAMNGLMNIVKNIDSNFTTEEIVSAFRGLFLKYQKFESNL